MRDDIFDKLSKATATTPAHPAPRLLLGGEGENLSSHNLIKMSHPDNRHCPCYGEGVNHLARTDMIGKNRRYRHSRAAVKAVRSLDEVAGILGLSRQRVYEIESRAFKKLREALVQDMPSLELRHDENGLVDGLREVEPHSFA
jgi:hypothetical protein